MKGSFQREFWENFEQSPAQCFKAESNYTRIIFSSGKELVSAYTLKYFDEKLRRDSYFRVNRSVLVRVDFIEKILKKEAGLFVCLKSGEKIKIPRREEPHLIKRKALQQYINNEL